MIRTTGRLVQLTSGQSNQLASASPRRKSITFTFSGGTTLDQLIVGNTRLLSATDGGAILTVQLGNPAQHTTSPQPITLTVDTHGDCVMGEWHCWSGSAGEIVAVLEGLADCQP